MSPHKTQSASIAVIEEREDWLDLIRVCVPFSNAIVRIRPNELNRESLGECDTILLDFSAPCIRAWFGFIESVDMTRNLRNLTLLNAPTDQQIRLWFQELGFSHFIESFEDLNRFLGIRYPSQNATNEPEMDPTKLDKPPITNLSEIKEQLKQKLPWK